LFHRAPVTQAVLVLKNGEGNTVGVKSAKMYWDEKTTSWVAKSSCLNRWDQKVNSGPYTGLLAIRGALKMGSFKLSL